MLIYTIPFWFENKFIHLNMLEEIEGIEDDDGEIRKRYIIKGQEYGTVFEMANYETLKCITANPPLKDINIGIFSWKGCGVFGFQAEDIWTALSDQEWINNGCPR